MPTQSHLEPTSSIKPFFSTTCVWQCFEIVEVMGSDCFFKAEVRSFRRSGFSGNSSDISSSALFYQDHVGGLFLVRVIFGHMSQASFCPATFVHHTVKLSDVHLHYVEAGKGVPVVLVHGKSVIEPYSPFRLA